MRNSNRILKYPIKMNPVFKDYLWGGRKLVDQWGKKSGYDITAESWELSAHKNGESTAADGVLKDAALSEIIEKLGKGSLGSNASKSDRFPILIKLIDSEKRLSIQVHPDDEYSLKNEGDYGKTEMWYIAQADEGASILCGFKENITQAEYEEYIKNDTITDYLNRIPVKKGDVFFISPGTVHAICEGTVIAEIQQNSDVTYRVYDYNRKGPDGRTRPLHVEKAIDVSRLTKDLYDGKSSGGKENFDGYSKTLLSSCKYFTVVKYECKKNCLLSADDKSFHALVFTEGEGLISHKNISYPFAKGDTYFIPADSGEYVVSGDTEFLLTTV